MKTIKYINFHITLYPHFLPRLRSFLDNFPYLLVSRIREGEQYTKALVGWKLYRHRMDAQTDLRISFNLILFSIKFYFVFFHPELTPDELKRL